MTDKATETSEATGNARPAHLEELFLIAQFYARDTDEAARLVDRVYQVSAADHPEGHESLSVLVERLVKLFRSRADVPLETVQERPDARSVRAREADRFLAEACRLRFLELQPDERLALWHAVESGGDPGLLLESDPLGRFTQDIQSSLTLEQKTVFGQFVSRSTVASALRRFWDSAFVPVPPTLRSVVESTLTRIKSTREPVRLQTAEPGDRKPTRGLLTRITIYAWVIVAATLVGYLLTRAGEPTPPSNDILELSLSVADDLPMSFRTDNAEQAERYIQGRLGWRLSLPEITDATLQGISLVTLVDSVQMPVLVYEDQTSGSTIPVFTFSYSFLESNRDRIRLSRETLRQIQETARFDVHQFKNQAAIVWRNRDDIFAAFVAGDQTDFQSRVVVRS